MLIALVAMGYLLGSIPVAWIIAKLVTGEDLRQMGSGNVGVMNTALSIARWAGFLVFVAEACKGMAALLLAQHLQGSDVAVALTVLAAVAGTRWSIWLRGAGGRGNTAGLAAIILLSWLTAVSWLIIWCLARAITKSSFLATRIGLLIWPFLFGLFTGSWWNVLFGAGLSLMYLSTQDPETDDHLLIKERWPNLWGFLSGPKRP